MSRRLTSFLTVLPVLATLTTVLAPAPAEAAPRVDKRVGYGNAGLASARGRGVAHCPDDLYVAIESSTCVHGADEAPMGVDVTQPMTVAQLREAAYDGQPPAEAATIPGVTTPSTDGTGQIVCDGDGVLGKRVQVLYVRTSDVASRFAALQDTLQQDAVNVDTSFDFSAAQTGGARHVRFVTDPDGAGGCTLDLKEVVIAPPTAPATNTFGYSVTQVKAAGYTDKTRKYLMFTDADLLCGIGSFYSDDKVGSTNLSDYYAAEYARVDTGCWSYAAAHELMHNMGGVQNSAAHSSGAAHCYDEDDIMCYSDGGSWFKGPDGVAGTADDRTLQKVCAVAAPASFDCKKDDYYNTAPEAGSYLATHWNTALSSYLIQVAVPASGTVHVTPVADSGGVLHQAITPLQLSATDDTAGQTVTWSAAGLPSGLSVNPSTGVISGTPTSVGQTVVLVRATDGTQAVGIARFTWTIVTVPSAPGSLTVAPGRHQLMVSWTTPNNGGSAITGYTVSVTPAGGSATSTPTGSTSPSYVVTGLLNGTAYDVAVLATNSVGNGPSATGSGTPAAVAPTSPQDVIATTSDGAAGVAFQPPADDGDSPVTSYTATASTGETVSGMASPLAFTGLANDVARTFTVTATNTPGTSAPSAPSAAVGYWTSTLTETANYTVMSAGAPVTLSGMLTSGPAVARPLTLQVYAAGQPLRTVPLTTTASGAWSSVQRPLYTTSYRVLYAGDSSHRSAASALVKVGIRTRVTISSPKTGTRTTNRILRLTGGTSPNKAGTLIRLYLVRRDKSLAYLTAVRVSSKGTFVFTKTLARGTYTFQVAIGATSTNLAGHSLNMVLAEV